MNITVIGAGNIGMLLAAEFTKKGHCVSVCSAHADAFDGTIDVLSPEDELLYHAKPSLITSSMQQSLKQAQMVWITVPAQLFSTLSKEMEPYVTPGMMIGVVPGSGGAEFAFSPLIAKGCILFGLQRVHSIARCKEYAKSVRMLGRKKELVLGSIPSKYSTDISGKVEDLLDIPCKTVPNYLCVTLTPSNPILHTTRLFTMFHDYTDTVRYPQNILFYEEWDDESSKRLIECDQELQNLCKKIPLDLKAVVSLTDYYESKSPQEMTKKLQTIKAFHGILSPMKQKEDGWVPDFDSRYFTADFSYGLKVIIEIAYLFRVKVTALEQMWDWYISVSKRDTAKVFHINPKNIDAKSIIEWYN